MLFEQGLKQNSNRKFTGLLTGTNRKLNTRRGVIFPQHKVSMKKLWWRKSDCESRRQNDSHCWPGLETRWNNSVVSDKGSKLIWGFFCHQQETVCSVSVAELVSIRLSIVHIWCCKSVAEAFHPDSYPCGQKVSISIWEAENYTTTTTTEHYFIFSIRAELTSNTINTVTHGIQGSNWAVRWC